MATPSEQDSKILSTALHWIWSCCLQIERHSKSTLAEWSCSDRPLVEQRKIFSATSYDEHLLLIAAGNLLKALGLAEARFPGLNLETRERELIKALRNAYEHWEDHQAPSFGRDVPKERVKQTAKTQKKIENLEAKPWSISYGPEGPVLCDTISLRDFLIKLEQLEEELLNLNQS